jgi:hypothetical protein
MGKPTSIVKKVCEMMGITPSGMEILNKLSPEGVVWGTKGVMGSPSLGAAYVKVPDAQGPLPYQCDEKDSCIGVAEDSQEAHGIVLEHNRQVIRAYELGRKSVETEPPNLSEYYRGVIGQVCEGFNISPDVRKVLETALWNPPEITYPSDDDKFIVETIERAKIHCVHPEANTTRDIGRAVLAATRLRYNIKE